jgi:capsular exopolysaccharide synthesis family protein
MQYFTKETRSPVILVTSSIPEEGKTFTAINLASVYSLIGKKTVLVDFDLRKPKIDTSFDIGNQKGVSTLLMGKDGLEDVIKETPNRNLFIIPAGPVPPNPSEIAALEKTNELIRLLKEKFECIIIDSSPIGTVSDASHIATLVDTTILIVRQNMTKKDILANTINELKSSDIKSLSIIMNDLGPEYKLYGYSRRFGYSHSK